MANYFKHFPSILYNGKEEIYDITRRTNFVSLTLNNPLLFLPYTVKEGELPEDIAYHYYGSVNYTWLVLLANNMLDPYHDWPLSDEVFNAYLIDKYKDLSGKKGYAVIDWAQNETILDNVVYYYKEINNRIIRISAQTLVYQFLLTERGEILQSDDNENIFVSVNPPEGYIAYRLYDYERTLNENKREIVLVDKQYLPKIETDFKKLIKQ